MNHTNSQSVSYIKFKDYQSVNLISLTDYQIVSITEQQKKQMTNLPPPLMTKPVTATTTTYHHKQCSSIKEDTRTNDKLSRITSHEMNDGEGKIKTSSDEKEEGNEAIIDQ